MFKEYLNLIILILGIIICVLSSYLNKINDLILTLGILIMLFGLFRISTSIPSKVNDIEDVIEDEEE